MCWYSIIDNMIILVTIVLNLQLLLHNILFMQVEKFTSVRFLTIIRIIKHFYYNMSTKRNFILISLILCNNIKFTFLYFADNSWWWSLLLLKFLSFSSPYLRTPSWWNIVKLLPSLCYILLDLWILKLGALIFVLTLIN